MSIQTLSALLAAILTFVIGWSVILRDRSQRSYITFTILCFNLAFWYSSSFFAEILTSDFVRWTSLVFLAAIPSSAVRFFRSFLAPDPMHVESISRPILLGTAAIYALLAVGLFYPIFDSILFVLPLNLFVFGSLGYCMYLIYERQQGIASKPEATRLKYLFYGGAATIVLAATEILPSLGVSFPAVGNVLTVIYLYFISQTLFHFRLLDIKELLGKMVSLTALVLLLTTIYGILLAWVGPNQPGVFFFNTVVASFVILVIFEPLRTWLENRVSRSLFREKYEFSRRLHQLSRVLVNIIQERPLVFRILAELENSGRVTHASIYLTDASGTNFRLIGHIGPAPPADFDATTRRLFLDHLRNSGTVTVEGLERVLNAQLAAKEEDASAVTRNIMDTLEEIFADVCIPLLSEGQLLGLLNLRDDRLREAYGSDELEQLREVALQTAITLRNSQAYEQLKERDRLAALGQMAAGLAHEIRNPLGAIKGAAQLLKDDLRQFRGATDTPTETREFLEIIVEEVNRLDHVVSQFLGYARPYRGDRQGLNINEVVRRTIQLLASQSPDVEVLTTFEAELPPVRADADQLRQVFLNLAINGIQAMDGKGPLKLSTRLRRGFRAGRALRWVEIIFQDSGKGINPTALKDIFIPFFTTKEGGTGLGLPICQRIIENHGGTIEVRSVEQQGSTFTVVLPSEDQVDVTGTHVQSLGNERDSTRAEGVIRPNRRRHASKSDPPS